MVALNTIYCDLQLETSTSEFCPIIEVVTPGCKRSNSHRSVFYLAQGAGQRRDACYQYKLKKVCFGSSVNC